jgi:hypothetical protein
MIKPKYPMNADLSQLARLVVEHAIGEPLMPPHPLKPKGNNAKRRSGHPRTAIGKDKK